MKDNWASINFVANSVASFPARPTLFWTLVMMLLRRERHRSRSASSIPLMLPNRSSWTYSI
jgi:hypothetical protein